MHCHVDDLLLFKFVESLLEHLILEHVFGPFIERQCLEVFGEFVQEIARLLENPVFDDVSYRLLQAEQSANVLFSEIGDVLDHDSLYVFAVYLTPDSHCPWVIFADVLCCSFEVVEVESLDFFCFAYCQ